jgi:hypothetical protein
MPSSTNRLRHLITMFNDTPKRSAMVALCAPLAAANTI